MIVHLEQVECDLSVAETWKRVADPLRVPTWDPGIVSVVPIEAGSAAVGHRYRVALRFGSVMTSAPFRILALEPPHRIVLASEGRWVRAVDDVLVEHKGARSRVTWRAELQLRGPARLLAPIARRTFDAYATRAMAGLRAWLAKEAQAALTSGRT